MIEVNKIYNGNSLEVLKTFDDNSLDSCVTDPPYGINFMNTHWDYNVPKVEVWQEILRVLKPGGHLLCACGTRTQHRMAVNIEDAGFEIRDIISWIYATGFPKSLNVNKQLENEICNCKEEIPGKQKAEHDLRPVRESDISKEINFGNKQGKVLQSGLQEQSPHSAMQREEPAKVIANGKEPGMEGWGNDVQKEGQLQEHKIHSGRGLGKADGKKGRVHNGTQISDGKTLPEAIDKDGSSTSCRPRPNEQQPEESGTISEQCNTQGNGAWENCNRCGKPILPDGIGTALKPATELWTLARKPIKESTIAANVLKYGTGGINIDGSRIETDDDNRRDAPAYNGLTDGKAFQIRERFAEDQKQQGRFPANLILDEFTGKILDEQSIENGIHSAGSGREKIVQSNYLASSYDFSGERQMNRYEDDSIGASRFFYCPKADNFERNKGLKDFEKGEPPASARSKAAEGRENALGNPRANHHPTVKPIDLMRYLVKLITPKGGIVIDPYCGSGTTCIGAKLELINYIGIEREIEYCKIAEARIAAWNPDRYKAQTLF